MLTTGCLYVFLFFIIHLRAAEQTDDTDYYDADDDPPTATTSSTAPEVSTFFTTSSLAVNATAQTQSGYFDQLILSGLGLTATVVVLSLLIHYIRVSRRKSRLMKLYIAHLERGDEVRRPPNACAISNALCADCFCCCCADVPDKNLDCEELLTELDTKQKDSFTPKIHDFIRRCEEEQRVNREETRQLIKSLARTGSIASVSSSFRKLADDIENSHRKKKNRSSGGSAEKVNTSNSSKKKASRPSWLREKVKKNGSSKQSVNSRTYSKKRKDSPLSSDEDTVDVIPLHARNSSPSSMSRQMRVPSQSSLDSVVPAQTSDLSMHAQRNFAQGHECGMRNENCSRCSSSRFLPVSTNSSSSWHSPSRLCRKKRGSSQSSVGSVISAQTSDFSLHTPSTFGRHLNNDTRGHMCGMGSENCSRCSSSRLLPVSVNRSWHSWHSPSRLCRNLRGSSQSSLNSVIPVLRSHTLNMGHENCSQCSSSSSRLLPVSTNSSSSWYSSWSNSSRLTRKKSKP